MIQNIIQTIENFLTGINPSFGTFMVSMVPIIELRGAIPLGIACGLNWLWVYFISVVGNLLLIPLVIRIVRPIIEWLLESKLFHKIGKWLKNRTNKKQKDVTKYKKLGLIIFVAIPLPGTGAYSGAMIAGMMNMRIKDAMPPIVAGVCIAGAIMLIGSLGIKALF